MAVSRDVTDPDVGHEVVVRHVKELDLQGREEKVGARARARA